MHNTQSSHVVKPNVLSQLPMWFVVAIISVLLINRIGFHLFVSPLPDEAYYWLWGQRPALSYYDHPPLQAWFQGVTSVVFGNSLFGLRLPALLSSGVVIATLLWWARKVNLNGLGTWAMIAAAFSSPLIYLFTSLTFNDHLMIALLSLASILVFTTLNDAALLRPVNKRALYGAALLIGLAGLTKYNAALFAIGVVVATIWFPRFRPLLRSPHLYLAGILCLACLTPVFLWNYTNGAASFQYNLNDRLGGGIGITTMLERMAILLVSVVLIFSPFLTVAALKRPSVSEWLRNWRGIAVAIMLTTLAISLGLSYVTNVLYYWTIIGFVAILPFAVLHFKRRWQLVAHMLYGAVLISLYSFNYTVLPLATLFGDNDYESNIVYGWPEISAQSDALMQANNTAFMVASDYRSGAILAFWTDNTDLDVISERISQFTLWFDHDKRAGQDALILTDEWHPMSDVIAARFETVEEVSRIRVERFGINLTEYTFYIGRAYTPPM